MAGTEKGMIVLRKRQGGIRLEWASYVMTTFTAVMLVMVGVMLMRSAHEFNKFQAATQQYIICEKAANEMEDGSAYLTEQVRLFAELGDRAFMDAYFEEANVTQRREKALAAFRQYYDGTDGYEYLEEAFGKSVALMQAEYHAMKLVAQAEGLDDLPSDVAEHPLKAGEETLDAEEKRLLGRKIVNGEEYQQARATIVGSVESCMDALLEGTQKAQLRAESACMASFSVLRGITVLLGIVVMATAYLIICMVVRPLKAYQKSIQSQTAFPVGGTQELRVLGETYNKIRDEKAAMQKLLRHDAEHDDMTGLLNRGSFDRLLVAYENMDTAYALLMIDVDNFKHFNDTYGHQMGDKVLRRVAEVVRSNFRATDYACRIGGDEFAVIAVDTPSGLIHVIERKITAIQNELRKGLEEMPPVTLSVGVAFSDRVYQQENIFASADKAMYQAKENGKDTYVVDGF